MRLADLTTSPLARCSGFVRHPPPGRSAPAHLIGRGSVRRAGDPIPGLRGVGEQAAATDSATEPDDEERQVAYVTEKRGVFYAVIYEGRNPVSGRERRRWHRCDDHAAAARVADELTERWARQHHSGSSLTLAEYLPRPVAPGEGSDARAHDPCPLRDLGRALPAPPPWRHPATSAPDRTPRDALPATPARRSGAADRSRPRPSRTSTRSSAHRSSRST